MLRRFTKNVVEVSSNKIAIGPAMRPVSGEKLPLALDKSRCHETAGERERKVFSDQDSHSPRKHSCD